MNLKAMQQQSAQGKLPCFISKTARNAGKGADLWFSIHLEEYKIAYSLKIDNTGKFVTMYCTYRVVVHKVRE